MAFVFFNILYCSTTRRESRGSGELISNYSIDNNIIFIYLDELVKSTIIIDKKNISLEDYKYLLELLNKKNRK